MPGAAPTQIHRRSAETPRPIDLALTPEQVFAAWPAKTPLAAIWSGGPVSDRSRWTIVAKPTRQTECAHGFNPRFARARKVGADLPPFQGGWIGLLKYEHGLALEPAAAPGRDLGAGYGTTAWLRCDDALIFDRIAQRWWRVGNPPALDQDQAAPACSVGPLTDSMTRQQYMATVARVLEYIRAGDVYQVNLAHHLQGPFQGSPRSFFLALASAAQPWYGAYLETKSEVICSASPELFVSIDPHTRRVVTRPMKGTRPAGGSASELELSPKDTAELNMITDLMRNDLGRMCKLGTVRVDRPREIEEHASGEAALLQATATVSGDLQRHINLSGLTQAAFPGGSITGAPKIRAMQIISELEDRPRGAYCGSIGFISDSGHAAFNIAIRTATISRGIISYGVGAGIVADSDPAAEWQETLDKAGVFLRAARSAPRVEAGDAQ